jgi:hypothetical protein
MELDSGGNWKTLQLLRSKHQFFVASLERYKPAAQIKSSQGRVLPVELKFLVRLSGKDWDAAAEVLKEASERQAIMHLFACFERIIRVDGQLRGEQQPHLHHAFFAKDASAATSFVRFDQWLQCWVNAASAAKQRPSLNALRQLKQQFKEERNPLMHNDQAILPPFSLVARKLRSSLATVQHLASDFPLQR